MSPRGVYSSLQRGILEVPKGYFRVPRSVYFCFRRVRLGNTSIHVVYNILFVDRKLYKLYQMGLRDCLFFKMGIHQCGVWFKDLPRFDNCQKHVRCILPLENCILLTFERDTGEYYTFYERGILYLLKGVYYNPERGIL